MIWVLPPSAVSPATAPTIAATASRTSWATMAHAVIVYGRPSVAHFLGKGLVCLAHLGVAKMHFSVKVVGQAAVVVEPTQVGATHVAYLQLLVARRT